MMEFGAAGRYLTLSVSFHKIKVDSASEDFHQPSISRAAGITKSVANLFL